MKIVIGSKNPAKIAAVKQAFTMNEFEFSAVDAPSGVSPQPFTDDETITGAINRAKEALRLDGGQIGIGLEGGVQETSFGLFLCNWGALVESQDEAPIIAGGARILLPESIAEKLREGLELGLVMDEFTQKQNIRKNEGAIGIFTDGIINRADMFTHVTKLLYGQYLYRRKR
jgi:inosine/xanthosine triphosphatase